MNIGNSPSSTSLSLLSRIRSNDAVAWSQLVKLYAPIVGYWCRRQGIGSEDSADIIQMVFLAVARGLDNFRPVSARKLTAAPQGDGSFRAWLWVITRNKIRDWARSQPQVRAAGGSSVNQLLHEIPDVPEDEHTSPEILNQLLRRALEQIRSQFQPQTWDAFWRCVVDNQSTAVVAEQLQMKPASVRQARSRVLRQLRCQLGDQDG